MSKKNIYILESKPFIDKNTDIIVNVELSITRLQVKVMLLFQKEKKKEGKLTSMSPSTPDCRIMLVQGNCNELIEEKARAK